MSPLKKRVFIVLSSLFLNVVEGLLVLMVAEEATTHNGATAWVGYNRPGVRKDVTAL